MIRPPRIATFRLDEPTRTSILERIGPDRWTKTLSQLERSAMSSTASSASAPGYAGIQTNASRPARHQDAHPTDCFVDWVIERYRALSSPASPPLIVP